MQSININSITGYSLNNLSIGTNQMLLYLNKKLEETWGRLHISLEKEYKRRKQIKLLLK